MEIYREMMPIDPNTTYKVDSFIKRWQINAHMAFLPGGRYFMVTGNTLIKMKESAIEFDEYAAATAAAAAASQNHPLQKYKITDACFVNYLKYDLNQLTKTFDELLFKKKKTIPPKVELHLKGCANAKEKIDITIV
ncbi:lef-2 [Cnaphalocrocis medinalis granulovirus]|uniref:Lef-2 n=1 Tax=Cnaphalocrocis medinalis granulovirus TaxID=1750712 RepID=A0A109WXD9_9BBAC|nr:lef-2 [Cnaphalocrocis medinalis granulovirus]AMF83773.1 lef-2 [Cnaphalocrocis medinalis granulovirus]